MMLRIQFAVASTLLAFAASSFAGGGGGGGGGSGAAAAGSGPWSQEKRGASVPGVVAVPSMGAPGAPMLAGTSADAAAGGTAPRRPAPERRPDTAR